MIRELASILIALLVFGSVGYSIFQVDRTAHDGKLDLKAAAVEVKKDFKDVESFFASGASANHDRYND